MAFARLLLYPFSLLYDGITRLRNRWYRTGFFASAAFDVPVISVGNLSVGGTGKTPHVEYLAQLLLPDYQVAILSRGYRRRTRGFVLAGEHSDARQIGDEPMQYHVKFPGLAVGVAEERLTGIPRLLQERPDLDVVLLDDAYQHRKVRPGLSVLLTDYSRPFYRDHVLPYGRLREHRSGYRRADIVVVSKCPPGLSREEADRITAQIAPESGQDVFFSSLRYPGPYDLVTRQPASVRDRPVLLVCCIARPEPLEQELRRIAGDVAVMSFPDHHYFTAGDLQRIRAAAAGRLIVTTEKDAVRLQLHADALAGLSVAAFPVQVYFLFGDGSLFDRRVADFVGKQLAVYRAGEEDPATADGM